MLCNNSDKTQIADILFLEEMGCVASRIDQEEKVRVCRERKRLMKQLVNLRAEFSNAQFAYLRALRNTGATLSQFTDSESLDLKSTPSVLPLPPSPPPPLPPSPPPPPPPSFSPDLRKANDNQKSEISPEESIEICENDGNTTPPPPMPSSSWASFIFDTSSPHLPRKDELVEQVEEENWADTKTDFEAEDSEDDDIASDPLAEELSAVEFVDDSSSTMSWYAKDASNMMMVEWSGKKTLDDIIRELDDYFLRASDGGKDIAVFMDISRGDTFLPHNFIENKRKRSNSAKVFSALSWSWSSRSLQFTPDAVSSSGSSEPCRPGAHCVTLNKLYVAEQKLYKETKEEEINKLEHEKKSMLLRKQENENYNWIKAEKTRSCVENLECEIELLQHSIIETSSSILKLIEEELHPQLVALISGLAHMWRTMQECHQVQNNISQCLNHLTDEMKMECTTEYRRHAAAQLENEITSWYNSFCILTKSQREYVKTLCGWIRLTDRLGDDNQRSRCCSAVRKLSERWLMAFDKLPDKVAAEAIKSFLSLIQSISRQQMDEIILRKKSNRLEKRLQKELNSVAEMESKLQLSLSVGETANPSSSDLSPKHPLSIKHAKVEALKKHVEAEREKYVNSVGLTRTMTLNNLKTSLPNVFQALMAFSSASAQAFEAVHRQTEQSSGCDSSELLSACDSLEN